MDPAVASIELTLSLTATWGVNMERRFFVASAAAICMGRPLLAIADLMRHVPRKDDVAIRPWHESMWYCGHAVVWLNTASGIYYYKGDSWYGRTKRGGFSCEKEAIARGNRARREIASNTDGGRPATLSSIPSA